MSLKAVLFDMDGVIVDTEPLHHKAWYKTYEDFHVNMTDEIYESFTGQATKYVCDQVIEIFNLDISTDELIHRKRKYFKYFFDNDTEFNLLPGVKNLIEDLYNNNVTLILASSASMNTINWVFEKFKLNPFFKDKISGAELKASKPHPEIFEKAAQMANAPISNCIVIEDSTNGILAAKRADIFTIGYNSKHSKNQDYTLADFVINDFSEVNYKKMNKFVASEKI